MTRPSIVLSSRELFPFAGGGIGAYIAQLARVLAPVADVTILTAGWYAERHRELEAVDDPRVDYGGARVAFVAVPEPADHGEFYSHMHLYSHRVLVALRALFPDGGPDLVEFSDYLGEGFVPTQARRGGDPFLADTLLALRLHTSSEMANVLNGHLHRDFEARMHRDLERRALVDADVLVDCGGDIRGAYERFYAGVPLAPRVGIRYPLDRSHPTALPQLPDGGPLRMIYVGRCERRKGVQDLIAALSAFTADWRLTILGGDTDTAPLGHSMRRTLELQAAGDHRVTFLENLPRAEVPGCVVAHDVLVTPSRWECWPYVVLESMAAGVPVIACPVGGLTELVAPGVTGELTTATGVDALMETLGAAVANPAAFRAGRDPAAVRARALALSDPDGIRGAYLELIARPPRRVAPRASRVPPSEPVPLVSVVIPYYGLPRYVEEAVRSALAQTHSRIEVIVIGDGAFTPEDIVLAELATRYPIRVLAQANGGLGAARNFGIDQSRGRYVVPLDADNVLEPSFVARGVELLEVREDLHYVTSWSRYVHEDGTAFTPPAEGYRPVGNWSALVDERNVAGDATAVLRKRLFDRHRFSEDLTSYEDWALYRELAHAGLHGHVIPEMLWRYRVREDSMLRDVGLRREERLLAELDALIREKEVAWVSTNG
ncbi:glycosyltransferase [Paraconexibacter antarcticus]|uniref:Glycosyltransferase n=1 Tax=Paraconexibacter antarcticus TaxID=2949664 RepID=A0ABY5DSS5_9ACTN|nr:glycosyltransferase [Paraconexibacter antarcticus]UTI65073.1 glycosyltransferase [Paraconexibacter antarcticus]